MALFSRKKRSDDPQDAPEQPAATGLEAPAEPAEVPEPEAPAEPVPAMNISVSTFTGVGSAPTSPVPPASPEPAPPAPTSLPRAAAAPPTVWETVPGIRDNALLRDALAALPEPIETPHVLGVLRQLMQGHVFLRAKGDARALIAEGKPVSFGVATMNGGRYIMAYSSGRAIQQAVAADGENDTSAIAQPVSTMLAQLRDGDFAGIILDNHSAPRRVVLPRAVLEQALSQADPEMRLKTLLTQPRDAQTPQAVGRLLAEGVPLWLAVAELGTGENGAQFGIAEARLPDGTRLLQVHSHPLEIVVQQQNARPVPIDAAKLGKVLRENDGLGGVLVDPAGPLITLTRDELQPVFEVAAD